CFGNSAECGYTVFKVTDLTSLPFEDSVWAKSDYNSIITTYSRSYTETLFSVNAGSYIDDVDVSYQWYKIDHDKEKSGNYSEEDWLIPLSGYNKSGIQTTQKFYEELGEPYFEINEDNQASLFNELICIVTFTKGNETTQKELRFKIEYYVYVWYNGDNEVYVNRGDKVNVPEAFSRSNSDKSVDINEVESPDFISFKYTWIGLSAVPEQMEKDYWNPNNDIWADLGDYVILGHGKNTKIDTSNLPLFDYDEGKVSYIACVYEPVYNGKPVLSSSIIRGYYVFRIGYYDLVTADTTGVAVNETNFPDANFRKYISDNIDKNHSGYLTDSEISNVEDINVNNLNISDLTGIKYFTSLYALECGRNNLTSLDVSGMPELSYLYCNDNKLSSLNISNCDFNTLDCSGNNLSALTISKKGRLYFLNCSDNKIKTLDLSGQTGLSLLRCSNNGLTSLNITGCEKLSTLSISGNSISSIDLGSYPELKDAYENYPYYRIADGVSGYGSYYFYRIKNILWLNYGIELDDSTQVLNATPSTQASQINVAASKVDNGVKLTWNAVNGASYYEIEKYTIDESIPSVWYTTEDTYYIDKDVEDGDEYFYTVYAFNEKGLPLTLMKEPVSIFYGSGTPLRINTQPVDFTGPVGDTATFTVEAQGDGLKYQWQYSKDGINWKNSNSAGYNTPSMSVKITEARNGQQYRCIVTNSKNRSVKSATAKIIVGINITTNPVDFTGPIGTYAEFTVEAAGENLTYQWQYKNAKGVWKNSNSTGYNTASMKVKVTEARDGQKYRCIVTSGETSVTSGEAAIHVEKPTVKITSDPSDVTGPIGTYAKFTVVAEGENLTYQWQYMNSKG
ncbi:MAG: hypothetical protein IKM72_06880, partial [Oscillospiraceae bacterium]|nr:hypothetical protein [Oscillospiraceae bacterium]